MRAASPVSEMNIFQDAFTVYLQTLHAAVSTFVETKKNRFKQIVFL